MLALAALVALAGPALAEPTLPPGGVQAWKKALLGHRPPLNPPPDDGRARPDTVGVFDLIEVSISLDFERAAVPEQVTYLVEIEARQPIDAVPLLAVFYAPDDVRDAGGRSLEFVHSPEMGELVFFLEEPLRAGERAEFTIDATLTYTCDMPPGCIEDGGFVHIADGLWYPMSLEEPIDDRFIASLALTTRLPRVPSGTGARPRAAVVQGGFHHAVFRTEAATFLPAFSVGDYTLETRGRVEVFSPPGLADAAPELARFAEDVLEFYGELFAPYPFSRLGVAAISTNAGAGIGPQANILLPDVFWAIPLRDPALGPTVRDVTSHEIGHQYFFNLLGVVDNGEAWMSEGFAEYAATRHGEHDTGTTDHARINYWTYVLTVPPGEDEPLHGESVSASTWYYELVYLKGSAVLQALRHRFGTRRWDDAFAAYVAAFAGQIVTTAEFEAFMSDALGEDLAPFFADWIDGRGVVELRVSVTRGRTDQAPLTVEVRQSGPPAPVAGPLPIVVRGSDSVPRRLDLPLGGGPFEVDLQGGQWIEVDPELTLFRRVRPDPAGDVNLDGVVDGMDLLDVAFARGRSAIEDTEIGPVAAPDWDDRLDVDRDDDVDDADLDRLIGQFGQGW
ncbi:MAG: hypothetical protein H6701_03900 [Myxococcales bacterium]|nr:hypothetical protein [Myxococcales bacterium]